MSIPIQDSVIRSDSSNAGKLVLVDTRVQEKDVFLNSVKTNVSAIILDFKNDTYNSILTKIKNNMIHDTLESIALVSHGQYNDNYSFLEKENSPKLKNISLVDPNFDSWKIFLDFLIELKDLTSIKYLDLLGCAIVSYNEWKLILTYLESNSGIKVRASADNTGNLVAGGNWILETDNIDAKELYFTDKILNFTALLIVAPVISISPLNIVNISGANVSPFTISIPAGFTATSYQWYSSIDNITFTEIPQANTASYTPSDTTRHITYYYCKLNNSNTHSSPKVYLLNSYKLLQSVTPINTSLIIISNNSIISNITWESSPDNNSWTSISTATSKNYTPNNTMSGKYIRYTCDFTYNSNTRTITSNSTQILLSISKQPIDIIKTSTGTNTKPFTITANVATYQWQISNSSDPDSSPDSSTFSNITGVAGALTSSYLPIESTDSTKIITYYRCLLNGCAYSNIVYLLSSYRIITQQPANIINNLISDSNSFNITVVSNYNSLSLKWQRLTTNSTFVDIDGATGLSFTPDHTTQNITYYRCQLNINILGTTYSYYSNTVYLLNAYLLLPPTTIYGAPLTVITGASTIQWRLSNDNNTSNSTPINGATSAIFRYNNTVISKYISYTCSFKYNNITASITSNSTQILQINITQQPSNYIISPNTINTNNISNIIVNNNNSGNDFNITLNNSGTNIIPQWEISTNHKVSYVPINGANNLTYSPISNIAIAYYRCMLNKIYSSESAFLLNTNLLLPISTKSGDLLETISKITNIQWQKSDNNSSWSNISGATSTIYIPDNTLISKYIRYTFTFNNINNINSNSTVISSRVGGPVDNNSYLTAGVANSTFLPLAGGTLSGSLQATSFIKAGGTGNLLKDDGTTIAPSSFITKSLVLDSASSYVMADGSTLQQSAASGNSNYYTFKAGNYFGDSTGYQGDAPPADGFVNWINIPSQPEIVLISKKSSDGIDITPFIKSLSTLNDLYIQKKENSAVFIRYNIIGVDNSNSAFISLNIFNKESSSINGVVFSYGTELSYGTDLMISFFSNLEEADSRFSALESKLTNYTYSSVNTRATLNANLEAKEFVKSNSTAEDYLMGNGSTSKTDDISLKSKYFNYNVSNAASNSPVVESGFVSFNQLSFNTNTTEVYLSTITRNGVSITDYFPSLGTGVGYYLYVYDASNLTKYVKYYITGISDVASSVVSNPNAPPATITIPASKKITVRINPSAVSGDFKADLDTSQSPAVPRKVLVSIMADATEIDTRLANSETRLGTLERTSPTVLIESIVTTDTQEAFNLLDITKTYIDMRTSNTVSYAGREFGCSFKVTGTTTKVPSLVLSYASLPQYINIKNKINSSLYDSWSKPQSGGWFSILSNMENYLNYHNLIHVRGMHYNEASYNQYQYNPMSTYVPNTRWFYVNTLENAIDYNGYKIFYHPTWNRVAVYFKTPFLNTNYNLTLVLDSGVSVAGLDKTVDRFTFYGNTGSVYWPQQFWFTIQ